MNEHTRTAVDRAFAQLADLEPAEFDDAIEELERRMIARAEQRDEQNTSGER